GVNIYPEVGESRFTLSVAYSALTSNDDMIPKEFTLHPVYPNPFNPSTTISFDIPAQTHSNASLRIYDITGRLVATLVDEQLAPGTHTLQWQPVNLSSGLYIVQLKAGNQTFNQKISYIK
ncbi:MAG: T9SS type A sorting domain-containing protein, partial [Candidatus Marinimicrobia bacterium]|nr:T9SS type A sorting domain-containing protein [Candidatus Neomarinimicrobiota bacterium]